MQKLNSKFNKFFITTPIYYVNALPHIGHSYTNIAGDSLARFMRQKLNEQVLGEKVWFLTGTDEHGQKIQKAADEAKLNPQEFVDKVVVQFKNLWEKLNISHNDFIRTTENRHISCVRQVLNILYKSGDIYQAKYEGWYCTPCETFWTETQITAESCPDCQRKLEKISEANFFFKLSKYQDWLLRYIQDNPLFVRPQIRYNEVLAFLKLNKLSDLCISRPKERLSWGIPLPFSEEHVTYVWFDALINYISAVGRFNEQNQYESVWWQPDVNIVHLIGKDILRHHAVYWTIMLHALGIKIPDTIFAHGWWLIADTKMSKSRGNVVSPLEMADKFGIDTYRYFLLRDVPFGLDGNFSEGAIIKRFNSDLANDLGNLVYRTLTMIEKYFQGNIPQIDILNMQDERAKKTIEKMQTLSDTDTNEINPCLNAIRDFNFGLALEEIWELINMANKYIEETKPWVLSKDNKIDTLKAFIRLLVEVIRRVSQSLKPFMPQTAQLILDQIGNDVVKKTKPLFPRISK